MKKTEELPRLHVTVEHCGAQYILPSRRTIDATEQKLRAQGFRNYAIAEPRVTVKPEGGLDVTWMFVRTAGSFQRSTKSLPR